MNLFVDSIIPSIIHVTIQFLISVVTFDGIIGSFTAIGILAFMLYWVCDWAGRNFTTDDDPFRYMDA